MGSPCESTALDPSHNDGDKLPCRTKDGSVFFIGGLAHAMMTQKITLDPERQAVADARLAEQERIIERTRDRRCASDDEWPRFHKHDDEDDEADEAAPSVSEEQVLEFIRSRQSIVEKLRAKVAGLRTERDRLQYQLELEEKKNAILRKALKDAKGGTADSPLPRA